MMLLYQCAAAALDLTSPALAGAPLLPALQLVSLPGALCKGDTLHLRLSQFSLTFSFRFCRPVETDKFCMASKRLSSWHKFSGGLWQGAETLWLFHKLVYSQKIGAVILFHHPDLMSLLSMRMFQAEDLF